VNNETNVYKHIHEYDHVLYHMNVWIPYND